MLFQVQKIHEWYEKNERLVSPAVFFFGFLFDNLTLQRIDRLFDISILLLWLFGASLGIFLTNVTRHKTTAGGILGSAEKWAPPLIQFSFGALFSGFTVFYMRSASFSTSWPFLAILLFIFIGNEFFKKRYLLLNFQVTILFITVFFLSIFFVPIIVGEMGSLVFLASGVVSLIAVGAFVHFLFAVLPVGARKNERALIRNVGIIYIAINILYFTNIIPPIPLSLKDAGVYHFVSRNSGGNYSIEEEYRTWMDYFRTYPKVYLVPGNPLYLYSAVFAPTRIDTSIVHDWQYYSETKGKWISSAKVTYPIFGGADGGYRGYSEKISLTPGKWRVNVATEQGQILGRVRFEIVSVSAPVSLKSIIR